MKKAIKIFFVFTVVFSFGFQSAHGKLELVGNYPYGFAHTTEIDEIRNLAFHAVHYGIFVLDMSTPATPAPVATIPVPGEIHGLFYSNNILYVAAYNAGLRIIDVSNPTAPREIGFYITPGPAVDVAVNGGLAFVAGFNHGLRIIDISNPGAPEETGFFDTSYLARGVAVSGDLAYVANDYSGLRIIDVSDPAAPVEVGFHDTPGDAYEVVVSGGIAYVADDTEGLRIIDVSNPSSPKEISYYDTPYNALGVTISGTNVYIAHGYVQILDVSDPNTPEKIGHYYAPTSSYDVAVFNGIAYVSAESLGLRIVDVSNPASPEETGFFDTPNSAFGVTVSGGIAYVAAYRDGLRIVDVSSVVFPVETGFYDTPGFARGVAVSGNFAYVADGDSGLRVIDISNPASPVETGFYDTPKYAFNVTVSGEIAFVADGFSGLQILNVSNPASPEKLGSFVTPSTALDIFLIGDIAYVAAGVSGLRIIDVSNLAVPDEIGFYDMNYSKGVAVSDGLAYVADGDLGLRIIDVSNPSAPEEIGFYDTDYAMDVAVSGGLAYVADDNKGLRIIDVSDPAAPVEIDFFDTPDDAQSVYVSGFLVYIADGEGGLNIFRYKAPGIVDVQPTGVNIGEPSGTGSFVFRLAEEPGADVIIELVNTRPTEYSLSQKTVTLNAGNRKAGVEVTVTARDDAVLDGTQRGTVITKPAFSMDAKYNGFNPENIVVTVEDDEKEVGIFSVYPTYGTEGKELPVTIRGKNFKVGTTKVYISDYPGGGNEKELSADVVGEAKMVLTIPGKPAGNYNLKAANGAVSTVYKNAVSFNSATIIEKEAKKKAIIVAGGGNNPANDLVYASRTLGDRAYLALNSQGYTDEAIFYLNAVSSDVNGDGKNDVDRKATTDNLSYALNYWAKALDDPNDSEDVPPAEAASDLLLYITGPGQYGAFRVNYTESGWETITADTLGGWLDDLDLSGVLVAVYDASLSGSFLAPLAGENRVVITGTQADERAWFLDEGHRSFSRYFWDGITGTGSVTQAFLQSKNVIRKLQTSLMDDDGDGNTNRRAQLRADPVPEVILGRGRSVPLEAPVIGEVTTDPAELSGVTTAKIMAGPVDDVNQVGISSAWARIIPPLNHYLTPDVAVIAVPTLRLEGPDSNEQYSNTYDDFSRRGVYDIFVHMQDKSGMEAVPVLLNLEQPEGVTAVMGDITMDEEIDLRDLLIVMKLIRGEDVSQMYPYDFIAAGVDVNGDKRIGNAEALYILEIVCEVRK